MAASHFVGVCLVLLAIGILASGLDDLFVDLVCLWQRRRGKTFRPPSQDELNQAPRRQIAVLIPLWQEHEVIGKMLDHNVAANRYDAYDLFLGAYPNDQATLEALDLARRRYFNLHIAVCPHDGPTSKADCLNWIYQRMLQYEENCGVHFDIVVTHDAEDLIHPDSLRLINYYSQFYDMVQVPVLPIRRPAREWTHGLYCDEFAEYQTKDIPVRQLLRGFLPSNGVGTGYSRNMLDKLAAANANRVFEPSCLTEDYENGYRIHALNGRQFFVPVHRVNDGFVATREIFPQTFAAAVRQRTRWTMGIALQSWERHGWKKGQRYWFWRDRKGLMGNLLSPLANLCFAYGAVTWFWRRGATEPAPGLAWLFCCTLALAIFQLGMRAWCVARIYGWQFALGVPARAIWGNCLNCAATAVALWRYARARLRKQPLVWLKTRHAYPSRASLMAHKRRLGELLVAYSYVSQAEVERVAGLQQPGERIGECLVRAGILRERQVYEALSMQQNLPLERPKGVSRRITRALPARVARRWKVLPFRVSAGQLYVAGPELPSDEMTLDLRRFSSLEIRFQLVTPTEFEEMAREYLP